jgi:hypothetical protein
MRPTNIIRTLAAVALIVAPAAQAQGRGAARAAASSNVQTREGLTISFGLGGGSAAMTCPGCGTSPRETGLSGFLRVGTAISPSLVIAAESNGWSKTIQGVDTRMGSLNGIAQWYPSLSNGFFVNGGLGMGYYSESDPTGKASAIGLGYQVGTGYDYRIKTNFSLTPYMNYVGMANSTVKANGASLGKIGVNDLQYGLGFTWH